MWITNGPNADTLVVYAKTDPERRARGALPLSWSKIPSPGFSCASEARQARHARHPTPASSCSRIAKFPRRISWANCGRGVNVLMSGLDYERAVLAAGPLGIMQACLDTVHPLRPRTPPVRPGDRRISAHSGQARGYVYHNERRARPMCTRSRKACDRGRNQRAKMLQVPSSTPPNAPPGWPWRPSRCLGGNGYINDYPTGRLLRDAKLYEIGAGTSEIRRMPDRARTVQGKRLNLGAGRIPPDRRPRCLRSGPGPRPCRRTGRRGQLLQNRHVAAVPARR